MISSIFAPLILYGVVLVFVMMASRNFFSGRTQIRNPYIVAAVITLFIMVALILGDHALPVFALLALALIVGLAYLLDAGPKER